MNQIRQQVIFLTPLIVAEVFIDTVFSEVSPLITSLCDGYNICIMAYGQTGSGKTHTMLGDKLDGLIPKAAQELFEYVSFSGAFRLIFSQGPQTTKGFRLHHNRICRRNLQQYCP